MSAVRLDGKACAADLEERLKQRIAACSVQPHLAVIIVGDDPASHVYVNNKIRSCERLGIRSTHIELPEDTEESVVADYIRSMNEQEDLHGILIQSPLPKHMDEESLTELINPLKMLRIPSCQSRSFGSRTNRWHDSLYAFRCHGNATMG